MIFTFIFSIIVVIDVKKVTESVIIDVWQSLSTRKNVLVFKAQIGLTNKGCLITMLNYINTAIKDRILWSLKSI